MPEAKDYHLRVTAGPSYDPSTQQLVAVNEPKAVVIKSEDIDAKVNVRIQNYRGLPPDSPSTSPYFSKAPHTSDLYSISFSFSLSSDIPGTDLLFGNDFEHAIRDKLPPGFNAAFRLVRWAIDPGLNGDVQADKPYLYGPLLSSINALHVGEKAEGVAIGSEDQDGETFSEGGEGSGQDVRQQHGVPDAEPARMKHFLNEGKRKDWTFEKGREYGCDFFNPYLDFNDLALKLPGISLHLMGFWDGQPLRYVLKHKTADGSIDRPLLVIIFTLMTTEEADKEAEKEKASGKEAAAESQQTEKAASKGNGEGAASGKAGYFDEDVD